MADVGQELALGTAGRFGSFTCLAKQCGSFFNPLLQLLIDIREILLRFLDAVQQQIECPLEITDLSALEQAARVERQQAVARSAMTTPFGPSPRS